MTGVKISELTDGGALQTSDQIEVNRGGASRRVVPDASGVPFDLAATGSVERSVAAKLGDVVHGTDFGVANTVNDFLRVKRGKVHAQIAVVSGTAADDDGAGGIYVWDATSAAAEFLPLIILPSEGSGNGRWVSIKLAPELNPNFVPGDYPFDEGLKFNGFNDAATIAASAWVQPTDVYMPFVVFKTGADVTPQNIWNRSFARWTFEISDLGSGPVIRARARRLPDTAVIMTGTTVLQPKTTYIVVVRVSATENDATIYTNGALDSSASFTIGGWLSQTANIEIGQGNASAEAAPFNGILFSIGFLTSGAIADVASALNETGQLPNDYAGLVGQWVYNGAGFVDTINAEDATLVGGSALTKASPSQSFTFSDVLSLLLNDAASLGNAGETVRASQYEYRIAEAGASDHHIATAGGVKLYIVPSGQRVYAEQFGLASGSSTDAKAISAALEVAADICGEFVFDQKTYTVTGKVEGSDRIRVNQKTGLKIVIPKDCRIESAFDIGGADGMVNLFGFANCNNVTICGEGVVEVVVADNPPVAKTTFSVFFFDNKYTTGPDNLKFFGPLRLTLRGADVFSFDGEYAGYVIRMRSAADPAAQPTGFVCSGVDFSGSSGRIIQTQGALGAIITNNKLKNIGEHFVTVGIRSLGDAENQIIANNYIKAAATPTGLFTCITSGTNDVSRVALAKNNLIEGNIINLTPARSSGTRGVFVNGSDGGQVRNNLFISDLSGQSIGVHAAVGDTEISLGVDELKNLIIENNTFREIGTPLRVDAPGVGGTLSGIVYRRNKEINCGATAQSTADLTEFAENIGPTAIDASAGDTTSDLVAAMEFGKTYEVKLEETVALDGDTNKNFELGDGSTSDAFLSAVTATGSAVGYAVVSGTENVGLPLRVTVTNNASATAGEITATVIVK